MSFSFDNYGEQCRIQALKELLANRSRLNKSISWIKLQQGGQGEIWVSDITVNHGSLQDRDERNAVDLELDLEGDFPGHIEDVYESEVLQEFADKYDIESDELWESVECILHHELLVAGTRIREELKAQGIEVADDCVICCGDEDNTWGWNNSQPFDEATSLSAEDFIVLNEGSKQPFVELVYSGDAKRKWLLSIMTKN